MKATLPAKPSVAMAVCCAPDRTGLHHAAIHPAMTFTVGCEDIARLQDACSRHRRPTRSDTRSRNRWCSRSVANIRVPRTLAARLPRGVAHASNHIVTLLLDAVEALRRRVGQEPCWVQEVVGGRAGRHRRAVIGRWPGALENALQRGQAGADRPCARGGRGRVRRSPGGRLPKVDPDLRRV